jgi:DNA-binding NarL/FixJ family response regulator
MSPKTTRRDTPLPSRATTEHRSGSADPPRGLVRVVVVDDHPIFRTGLVEALRCEPDIEICGEADTVATALDAIAAHRPHVAIVDLSLGNESGLDLISALARTDPPIHALVISGHDERLHADRALRAGALGYIMKDKAARELAAAVRRVAAGQSYVSHETAERILRTLGGSRRKADDSPLSHLSDRERRVLTLMGRGLATREIARQLDLSVKTVESHYARIKGKLGLQSGRELMRLAVSWSEDNPT